MSTNMVGRVRRARKIDPNGNIYYDRGVSDIIFDPVRGTSVKDDIDKLRDGLTVALAYVAANPKGLDGLSAYEIAKNHGFEGTEYEWLQSLVGKPGEDGLNAYELACTFFGFTGTMKDYLDSLKGEKGDTGDSAYEICVKHGYDGSEEDWVNDHLLNRAITDEEIRAIYNKIIGNITEDTNDYEGLAKTVSVLREKVGTMDVALQDTISDVQMDNETNILAGRKTDGSEFQVTIANMATESDIDDLTDGYVPSTGSSVNGKDLAIITTEDIDDVTNTTAEESTNEYDAEFNALVQDMVSEGKIVIDDGKEGE